MLLTEAYTVFQKWLGEGSNRGDGRESNLRFNGKNDEHDGFLRGYQKYKEDQTEVWPHGSSVWKAKQHNGLIRGMKMSK